jgi:predicted phosphodiesterase
MLRLVGVLGDVHTEVASLRLALSHFGGVDKIVCVGDIADGSSDLDETCRILEGASVECVRGNHDRWFLDGELRDLPGASQSATEATRAFLRGLPVTRRYETAAGSLLLCHGLGENDMARVKPDDQGYALESNSELQRLMSSDIELVVNGHSHRRMVRKFGRLTIINAGTLHREYDPCFALVDFVGREARYFDLAEGGAREGERLVF